MSISRQDSAHKTAIASLYIQALRKGETLWFQVVSGSMAPTLNIGDRVRIDPVKAKDINNGDIAAFETDQGLVIHRIVQQEKRGTSIRLLEMGDVLLHASWVEEQAIVGRVSAVHRDTWKINLQHPIAKRCSTVTAFLRYRLYKLHTIKKFPALQVAVRRCSRLVVRIGYWCIHISSVTPI